MTRKNERPGHRKVPVGVALTLRERQLLHEIADQEGRSVSAQLRHWVRQQIAERDHEAARVAG